LNDIYRPARPGPALPRTAVFVLRACGMPPAGSIEPQRASGCRLSSPRRRI